MPMPIGNLHVKRTLASKPNGNTSTIHAVVLSFAVPN